MSEYAEFNGPESAEPEKSFMQKLDDRYVIIPVNDWSWLDDYRKMQRCPEGFRYSSETNDRWLTRAQLMDMVDRVTVES